MEFETRDYRRCRVRPDCINAVRGAAWAVALAAPIRVYGPRGVGLALPWEEWMRRREFIAGLGGAAAWPVMVLAQPVPIVGFLSNTPPDAQGNARFVAAFRRGLRDAGYISDQNVIIDFQSTNNQ